MRKKEQRNKSFNNYIDFPSLFFSLKSFFFLAEEREREQQSRGDLDTAEG